VPIIDCHGYYGSWPYPVKDYSVEDLEQLMAKFGIEKSCLASTYAINGDLAAGNQALVQAVEGRESLLGYVAVNPSLVEASQEEMRKHLGRPNFVGAIMHSSFRHRALDCLETREILKALLRYDKPLLLHLREGGESQDLLDLARDHPTVQFLVAEMGGEDWQPVVRVAKEAVNIYLDCGGRVADRDKIKYVVDVLGPNRILFGTNMPLVNPVFAVGMVRDSQISTGVKDRILYHNAQRLFGI